LVGARHRREHRQYAPDPTTARSFLRPRPLRDSRSRRLAVFEMPRSQRHRISANTLPAPAILRVAGSDQLFTDMALHPRARKVQSITGEAQAPEARSTDRQLAQFLTPCGREPLMGRNFTEEAELAHRRPSECHRSIAVASAAIAGEILHVDRFRYVSRDTLPHRRLPRDLVYPTEPQPRVLEPIKLPPSGAARAAIS